MFRCLVKLPISNILVSSTTNAQSVCRRVTLFNISCCSSHNVAEKRLPLSRCRTICRYSADHGITNKQNSIRRNIERFRISMSQEEKDQKLKQIEEMRIEEAPPGLFAKVKYYVKRYWYIALPVHAVSCILYFGGIYFAVKSGIDVISLLKIMHLPEGLIEKVKATPPSAGVIVVTLLLYKVCTPIRYATTLAGIQIAFWTLRRIGKLKTVREVEYGVRSGLENQYQNAIRKLNQRRNRASVANSSTPSPPTKIVPRRKNLANNRSDSDNTIK